MKKLLGLLVTLTLLPTLGSAKLMRVEGEMYAIWTNYPNEEPQVMSGRISGDLEGTINIVSNPDWQTNVDFPKIGTSDGEFSGTMMIEGKEYECEGVFVTTIINNALNKGSFYAVCSIYGKPDVQIKGTLVGEFIYNETVEKWNIFTATYRGFLDDHETQIRRIKSRLRNVESDVSDIWEEIEERIWIKLGRLQTEIAELVSRVLVVESEITRIWNALNNIIIRLGNVEKLLKEHGLPKPSTCGNGVCEEGETAETCPEDCTNGAVEGEVFITEGWQVTCPSEGYEYCMARLYLKDRFLAEFKLKPGQSKRTNWRRGYKLKLYGISSGIA